jgi:hypothetical protein
MSLTAPSSSTVVPFEPRQQPKGYFKLQHSLLSSTNWQSLQAVEIALFFKVAGRYNGRNNGQLAYSIREAKAELHIGHAKVRHSFCALERHELLICNQRGVYNFRTKADRYTKWGLTGLVVGAQPSTVNTTGTNGHRAQPSTVEAHTVLAASTNRRIDKDIKKESFFLSAERNLPNSASADPKSSLPSPATNGGVPRGAVRADDATWIEYGSWRWAWVERFGPAATGETHRRSERSPGFPLPNTKWEKIQAAALANTAAAYESIKAAEAARSANGSGS